MLTRAIFSSKSLVADLARKITPKTLLHILVHKQDFKVLHIGNINMGIEAVHNCGEGLKRLLEGLFGLYPVGDIFMIANNQDWVAVLIPLDYFRSGTYPPVIPIFCPQSKLVPKLLDFIRQFSTRFTNGVFVIIGMKQILPTFYRSWKFIWFITQHQVITGAKAHLVGSEIPGPQSIGGSIQCAAKFFYFVQQFLACFFFDHSNISLHVKFVSFVIVTGNRILGYEAGETRFIPQNSAIIVSVLPGDHWQPASYQLLPIGCGAS